MHSDLAKLSPTEAHEILSAYARRSFGEQAQASKPFFHKDDGVWEGWVSGVPHHVKAFILRPDGEGGWACRHVEVSLGESAPEGT